APDMALLGEGLMTATPEDPVQTMASFTRIGGKGVYQTAQFGNRQHSIGNASAQQDQIGVSHQHQRDMAIPTLPLAAFILVQAKLAFGLLEADFNGPSSACNKYQVGQTAGHRCVGMIVGDIFRRAWIPSGY